jgi:alkanesulfonate monooxygenase SsuD/methylene tetrahydromethanopterin reductase-like flavin-dependent oxidoreductase (luciferase family)
VFVTGPTLQVVGQLIKETRAEACRYGRNPEDLLFFMYLKVITGDTEAAAQRKYAEFLEQVNYDGALALLSGWSGIDFGRLDPDQPLEYVETNAVRTLLQAFAQADPTRRWTTRDVAKFVGIGGGGPVLVGAPEQVVSMLMEWVDAGVDGFNLAYAITPDTFADFIDGVVPVLQRRGLMQRGYEEGTFREKLFGPGRARLRAPHPAARYRRSA